MGRNLPHVAILMDLSNYAIHIIAEERDCPDYQSLDAPYGTFLEFDKKRRLKYSRRHARRYPRKNTRIWF
ncbi:hypothetical protein ACFX1X_032603 [Malus domestica]